MIHLKRFGCGVVLTSILISMLFIGGMINEYWEEIWWIFTLVPLGLALIYGLGWLFEVETKR